jgi:hypothetical protein
MDAATLAYDYKPPSPDRCASTEPTAQEGRHLLRLVLLASLSFA